MPNSSPRMVTVVRMLISHVAGLIVLGFYAWFGLSGGSVGSAVVTALVGAFFSLPFIGATLILVAISWRKIYAHPFVFAIIGPLVVCLVFWVFFGESGLLNFVAISSISSTLLFATLTYLNKPYLQMKPSSERYCDPREPYF